MVLINFRRIGIVPKRVDLSAIYHYNIKYYRNKYFLLRLLIMKTYQKFMFCFIQNVKMDSAWTFDIRNSFAVIMYGKYSLIAKTRVTITHHNRPKYWTLTFDWLVKSRGTFTCCVFVLIKIAIWNTRRLK